jgi:hypothetical protein
MAITPTEFRKNLFQLLQRASDGELIEIEYKNHTVQLVAKARRSKLARLVRRDILACSPEELEQFQSELSNQQQSDWERKWAVER